MNAQCLMLLATLTGASPVFGVLTPVPDKIACAVSDRQAFQEPDHVHLAGWLGTRISANEANRLAQMDPARLLEGYRKRPGRQAWDGEHVGKWLHAATLAWVNTGDTALRRKLDSVAGELIKCQLEDGYLGTYLEKDRWTEWDVWAHKYNLIGLMTYMRCTGNLEPLPACRGENLARIAGLPHQCRRSQPRRFHPVRRSTEDPFDPIRRRRCHRETLPGMVAAG